MEGRTKISLGGFDYPLYFGYLSYKEVFGRSMKLVFDDEGKTTDNGTNIIIYSGYENACAEAKKVPEISMDDFSRELDQLLAQDGGLDTILAVVQVWKDSKDVSD